MAGKEHDIQSKSHKLQYALMAILICVLTGVAFYANSWKEDRRIAQVIVDNNRLVQTRDIVALAGILPDSKLFDLDLYAIEKRVLQNPFIRSVGVHRDLPNRVRLVVEERMPVAAIFADGMKYVDDEGFILPSIRSQYIFDLPVLTGSISTKDLVQGKRTDNRLVQEALAFLRLAREVDFDLYTNISEVRLAPGGDMIFYTAEYGIPVIISKEDPGSGLVTFEGFWKEIVVREGAHRLRYIDLRFQDKVVVRWLPAS